MQRSNSKLALRHGTLAVQVAGARALQTPLVKARKLTLHVFLFCACMYVCTRLLRATRRAPGFRNSSRTGPVGLEPPTQAADGGKHAYPESGLEIAENLLEGGASRD